MRTVGISESAGPAGVGVFSQRGPGNGEERMGHHADGHVPVPWGPVAHLVLVQAE